MGCNGPIWYFAILVVLYDSVVTEFNLKGRVISWPSFGNVIYVYVVSERYLLYTLGIKGTNYSDRFFLSKYPSHFCQ